MAFGPDAKLFIADMEGGLHTFIAAEIIKKKLPIVVLRDEEGADFIMIGQSIKGDDKWHHSVFGTGKDKNEGSVEIFSLANNQLIWAGEAGDRSMLWGGLSRGGQRKVADRIVNRLKKDLFQ